MPVVNEKLDTYLARLRRFRDTINETAIQAHIHGPRGAWKTHEMGGACWMCDYVTFTTLVIDTWYEILRLSPNRYTFASDTAGKIRLSLKDKHATQ